MAGVGSHIAGNDDLLWLSARLAGGLTRSIGRELDTQNMFSLRIAVLQMNQAQRYTRKSLRGETQVEVTGNEPFVVALPTRELEVVVTCSREIDVVLSPCYWQYQERV